MVGDYRTSAQKAGKSAGQRQRRMARDRKRQNREANVYATSVRTSTLQKSRCDTDELGVYGVFKEDGEWVLTALAMRRDVEKLVSDRQGAVQSKTQSEAVVTPRTDGLHPEDGIEISRFDTKKSALRNINAESSTRVDSGKYIIKSDQWNRSMNTHKVDRDDYHDFIQSRSTSPV